ncbi:MAG: hypothetical protein ACKO37_07025 [Vampirovibrionales bacterium]
MSSYIINRLTLSYTPAMAFQPKGLIHINALGNHQKTTQAKDTAIASEVLQTFQDIAESNNSEAQKI